MFITFNDIFGDFERIFGDFGRKDEKEEKSEGEKPYESWKRESKHEWKNGEEVYSSDKVWKDGELVKSRVFDNTKKLAESFEDKQKLCDGGKCGVKSEKDVVKKKKIPSDEMVISREEYEWLQKAADEAKETDRLYRKAVAERDEIRSEYEALKKKVSDIVKCL